MSTALKKAMKASIAYAEKSSKFREADTAFFRFYNSAVVTHGKDTSLWPQSVRRQLTKLSDNLDHALYDVAGNCGTGKPKRK